jgi:integrase
MTATVIEPGTPLPVIVTCCARVLGEERAALLKDVQRYGSQTPPWGSARALNERWAVGSQDEARPWELAGGMSRRIDRLIADKRRPLEDRALWAMLYSTASRAEEVLRLNVEDLHRANRSAALGPFSSSRRATTTSALRSPFGFAKKRGLIFSNPTTGLKDRPADFALLPMADEEIRAIEQQADDLAGRVIIALAAENAARTGAIRRLTLDDLDLANRRITLAGRRQRLGDLSHRALRRWLRHRRTTWPHTSNPHVLTSDSPISGGELPEGAAGCQ